MKEEMLLSIKEVTPRARMTLRLICFLAAMTPAVTYSWNQATHAYIAERLGARVGYENLNEMWGSVAPDLFNFVFDPAFVITKTKSKHHENKINC